MKKNVIIFGDDVTSSAHVDNKGKKILGEGTTQGLDKTRLAAGAKYSINFTKSNETFALSLHYNGSNSFLFVNSTKIYQFKAKNSEISYYALCLGNIWKDFAINNMTKTGLKGVVKFFSVDFNPITNNDILDIHKYFMKRTWFKIPYWS